MGNDIAMVLLKGQGFRLNQDIQPICLPSEDADYERDLNCTISGFGTIETGKSGWCSKITLLLVMHGFSSLFQPT